jgi:hypothetical protein
VLLALLDVVGLDATNGVEKAGIAMAAHTGRLRLRGVSSLGGFEVEGGRKVLRCLSGGGAEKEGYRLFLCRRCGSGELFMACD